MKQIYCHVRSQYTYLTCIRNALVIHWSAGGRMRSISHLRDTNLLIADLYIPSDTYRTCIRDVLLLHLSFFSVKQIVYNSCTSKVHYRGPSPLVKKQKQPQINKTINIVNLNFPKYLPFRILKEFVLHLDCSPWPCWEHVQLTIFISLGIWLNFIYILEIPLQGVTLKDWIHTEYHRMWTLFAVAIQGRKLRQL